MLTRLSTFWTRVPTNSIWRDTYCVCIPSFQDGDKIELEVEGLGRLHINIQDDLKRTWSKETRLEREGKTPPTAPQLTGKYLPEGD